jgi:tetratricopeptide (TPR) repeat protein
MEAVNEALARAVRHHEAGQLQAAEEIYRQILSVAPNHADALHLLGIAASQQNNYELAVTYILRAIELNPNDAVYHSNLGNIYRAQGKQHEAIESCRRALAINPDLADAHNNLGASLKALGRLDEAMSCFRRALDLNPRFAVAHFNLGNIYEMQDKFDEAEHAYGLALQLQPTFVDAHMNLGVVLRFRNKLDESIACFRRALELQPLNAEAYTNLGASLDSKGLLDEAIACHNRAIELKPELAESHNNLGIALTHLHKLNEATAAFQRALELKPDFTEAHYNLGNVHRKAERDEPAIACYRRVLELNPQYAEVYFNLGTILEKREDEDGAIACLRRAVELSPDSAEAQFTLGSWLHAKGDLNEAIEHYQRAIALRPDCGVHSSIAVALLKRGDFKTGWSEYEWRWKEGVIQARDFEQPRWNGEQLDGRVILLHAEQGFGDTIQFIRYASMVKRLGGTVVVECQNQLVDVLRRCPGVDDLVVAGTELPRFDTHSPLLSLPHLFKTSLETIPKNVPYLFADAGLVDCWRERLHDVSEFRIGINWHGRTGKGKFVRRNIPLECFHAIGEIPGVRLISLQKEATIDAEVDAKARLRVLEISEDFDQSHGPFMDTAAIMKNLDLVITSDTSVAHLAGALGVAVWVALTFVADWRWLLDRSDSPWYPTMRLFRQKKAGDWAGVFEEIGVALRERMR